MKDCKLESSKSYAKYLMKKYLINTAEYKTADNKNDLKKILEDIGLPCYIKADGLAAGLSAIKAETEEEYFKISNKYLDGYFGKSSQKIIVENT